jgi:SAM-dependent methyltransferase
MNEYVRSNRTLWNGWTVRELASAHHRDVATVRGGGLSLRSIERDELGDVADKTLLHLQCNMGSDTLSWARLGACVTGVDLADEAIERARALAGELGIHARFLQCDLYALPERLDEQFDVVFASYGALCWLPDLARWAAVAARYVRPGGVFYMVEAHPATNALAQDPGDTSGLRFSVAAPYAHSAEPQAEVTGSETGYLWSYGLGEVVTALVNAGLRIELLREHPVTWWQRFSALTQDAEGWWRWPTAENTLPLLFSLRARKDI